MSQDAVTIAGLTAERDAALRHVRRLLHVLKNTANALESVHSSGCPSCERVLSVARRELLALQASGAAVPR